MKILIPFISSFLSFYATAKDLKPFDETYLSKMKNEAIVNNFELEAKVTYLSKLFENQQKIYEDRVSYLEEELRKSKDLLSQKSQINESLVESLKDKLNTETINLKKELASKAKSLFEYQRQIEKMKPTEDLRNMIKLNSELSSELRRSEDQIAIIHLKGLEAVAGNQTKTNKQRAPANAPAQ